MRNWGNQKPPLGINPINNGSLVGCWIFNENGGGIAYDLSGYNNHGVLTNMANPPTTISGWGVGKYGSAVNFDNSNDYVLVPYSQFASLATGTIIALVNPRATNSVIFGIADNSYTTVLGQLLYRSTSKFGFAIYSTDYKIYRQTDVTYPLNQWHTVAITQDGVGVKIYVNGKEIPTSAASTENGPAGAFFSYLSNLDLCSIGAVLDSSPTYGLSTIDYCMVFNRALSAQEIAEYYELPFKDFPKRTMVYFVPSGVVVTKNGVFVVDHLGRINNNAQLVIDHRKNVIMSKASPIENLIIPYKDGAMPYDSLKQAIGNKQHLIEYQGVVVDDNALPIESLERVLASEQYSFEHLKETYNSGQNPIDNIKETIKSEQSSIEHIEEVGGDNILPIDMTKQVISSGVHSIEHILGIINGGELPIDHLIRVIQSGGVPLEFCGKVLSDGAVPIEFTIEVSTDKESPIEHLIQVVSDGQLPIEWQATIANIFKDAILNIDWGSQVVKTGQANIDWQGIIGQTYGIPIEHLAFIEQDKQVLVEIIRQIIKGRQISVDWQKVVSNTYGIPIEHLSLIQADGGLLYEFIKQVVKSAGFPIEITANVVVVFADKVLPIEILGRVIDDVGLPIEISATLHAVFNDGVFPIEWRSGGYVWIISLETKQLYAISVNSGTVYAMDIDTKSLYSITTGGN